MAQTLFQTSFKTPMGNMIAIASDQHLFALKFDHQDYLAHLKKVMDYHDISESDIENTDNEITLKLQQSLNQYFQTSIHDWQLPIKLIGTSFQQIVWQALQTIPFGETWSYYQLACQVGNPDAVRAVASANGRNPISILVPCHRVINKNGQLGGYNGGLDKKAWLLNHEQQASGITLTA